MNHKIDDIALHGALSANVVGFCRLLRAQRAGVALGEEQDALRALAAIDLSDPEDFRLSLRTVLAKTPAEQKLFRRAVSMSIGPYGIALANWVSLSPSLCL